MPRIRGLDSIRAVCAFWVVLSHFGGPPVTAGLDTETKVGWFINGLYNNFYNGQAAVIIFFIISGFCIHFPFAKTQRIPSIPGYAARRYIRICVPLGVAMLISEYYQIGLSLFHQSILWSLVAELVYYTLYPLLLILRRKNLSWELMIGLSFVAGFMLVTTDPTAEDYPSWGFSLNWVLGLPCWMLGCLLAERTVAEKLPITERIWRWRAAVWATSVLCSILKFHSPIGHPWTLNLFAFVAVLWLAREISQFQLHTPPRLLEWIGVWSYSLYLMHVPASHAFYGWGLPDAGVYLNWLAHLSVGLIASYLFYLCIELPSHFAARSAGTFLTKPRGGNT